MLERLKSLKRPGIEWLDEGLALLFITATLSVLVSMKVWPDGLLLHVGLMAALLAVMLALLLVERRARKRRPATRWERWIATQPTAVQGRFTVAVFTAIVIPFFVMLVWTQELAGDQVTPLDGAILVAATVVWYLVWRWAVGRLKRTLKAYCAADIPSEDEGA